MRTIAFTAGKGGVGKTTLTSNIGVSLSNMGFRVCVLDANFTAPDLAIHFGLQADITIWDVLTSKTNIDDAVYEHDCGLQIVPGNTGVQRYPKDVYKRLKRKIRKLKYDFLLIDTPPGLGDDARAALIPAKEVVIVANPEWTSLTNAYRMYQTARDMKKKVLGIALNRSMVHEYEPQSEMVNKLTRLRIVGEIPEDISVRKSIAIQSPACLSFPKSPASKELERIAAGIGGINYIKTDSWLDRLMRVLRLSQ